MSSAVANLSAGAFCRARMMMSAAGAGISGRTSRGSGTGRLTCASAAAKPPSSVTKGTCPVVAVKSTAPSE